MKYKDYEITAEVIVERAEYSLDNNGNLLEFLQNIDTEPQIDCYGVYNPNTIEHEDWFDTIEEAKKYIDTVSKLK
jgi:hypothetical protein